MISYQVQSALVVIFCGCGMTLDFWLMSIRAEIASTRPSSFPRFLFPPGLEEGERRDKGNVERKKV
jgi:hypothetical protein